jgi:hypothetical protein
MPLLTVVNTTTSEVIISDRDKSFPTISVGAGLTKAGIKIRGKQLERAGEVLARLVAAGQITYSVSEDPDVPNDVEGLVPQAPPFASAVLTGTGAEQLLAHGLPAAPVLVVVVPTAGHDGSGAAGIQMPAVVEGVHTATDVLVTVSEGATFKVLAWS